MQRSPVVRLATLLITVALLLTGCWSASLPQDSTTADAGWATVATLVEDITVVAESDQSSLSATAATTFFESAPLVLLASESEPEALQALAIVSAQAQAPLLVLGEDPADTAAALAQLGTTKVFTASELNQEQREMLSEQGREIIDVRAEDQSGGPTASTGDPEDVVQLNRQVLSEHFFRDFPAHADQHKLSRKKPVSALTKLHRASREGEQTLVAVQDSAATLAAAATALAARASVVAYTGDPRSSSELLDRAAEANHVVAVTAAAGADTEGLASILGSAAAGQQLPGGGQLVFDGKRYVALYGSPITPALGLLGEQGTAATVAKAAEYAKKYDGLFGDDKAIPALEIIVTVASAAAGSDGNYSQEWDPAEFLPLIKAAEKAGQYVVLDFQPGRTTFVSQIKQYEELLKYPHVGVALDPEWRIGPNERHLARIGHVEAAEVNEVVDYLADFTKKHRLPQKALVLHQFQTQMLRDRHKIKLHRPELAVLIHADGQGTQSQKDATWDTLRQDAPDVAWGWKNFIDEDHPMLTPEQTAKIKPLPHFISYQ